MRLFKPITAFAVIAAMAVAAPQWANAKAPQQAAGTYVEMTSEEGKRRVREATHRADFLALSASFTTQITQTLCSVASGVTVLNALAVSRPIDPIYSPYPYFTQMNFFTEDVLEIRNYATVLARGMTLEMAANSIETHGAKTKHVHAEDITFEEFRAMLIENLATPGDFVIANYQRELIGQPRGAHFSPIGAYDEATDSFLLLDVARYKFPPVWVRADDLFKSMNTEDSEIPRSRGFILVSAS